MKCTACGGSGVLGNPPNAQACPICGGSGKNPFSQLHKVFTIGPSVLAGLAIDNPQAITDFPMDVYYITFNAFVTATGAVVAAPTATLQIQDQSTRYQFANQATHVQCWTGTGQNPYPLPVPYHLGKGVTVHATITDLSNVATTYSVALIGMQDTSA